MINFTYKKNKDSFIDLKESVDLNSILKKEFLRGEMNKLLLPQDVVGGSFWLISVGMIGAAIFSF